MEAGISGLKMGNGTGGEESRLSLGGGITIVFCDIGDESCFGVLTLEHGVPSRCVLTASANSSRYSLLSEAKLCLYIGDGANPLLYSDRARLLRFQLGESGLIGLLRAESGLFEPFSDGGRSMLVSS